MQSLAGLHGKPRLMVSGLAGHHTRGSQPGAASKAVTLKRVNKVICLVLLDKYGLPDEAVPAAPAPCIISSCSLPDSGHPYQLCAYTNSPTSAANAHCCCFTFILLYIFPYRDAVAQQSRRSRCRQLHSGSASQPTGTQQLNQQQHMPPSAAAAGAITSDTQRAI
jgi:hypothetical protein